MHAHTINMYIDLFKLSSLQKILKILIIDLVIRPHYILNVELDRKSLFLSKLMDSQTLVNPTTFINLITYKLRSPEHL